MARKIYVFSCTFIMGISSHYASSPISPPDDLRRKAIFGSLYEKNSPTTSRLSCSPSPPTLPEDFQQIDSSRESPTEKAGSRYMRESRKNILDSMSTSSKNIQPGALFPSNQQSETGEKMDFANDYGVMSWTEVLLSEALNRVGPESNQFIPRPWWMHQGQPPMSPLPRRRLSWHATVNLESMADQQIQSGFEQKWINDSHSSDSSLTTQTPLKKPIIAELEGADEPASIIKKSRNTDVKRDELNKAEIYALDLFQSVIITATQPNTLSKIQDEIYELLYCWSEIFPIIFNNSYKQSLINLQSIIDKMRDDANVKVFIETISPSFMASRTYNKLLELLENLADKPFENNIHSQICQAIIEMRSLIKNFYLVKDYGEENKNNTCSECGRGWIRYSKVEGIRALYCQFCGHDCKTPGEDKSLSN